MKSPKHSLSISQKIEQKLNPAFVLQLQLSAMPLVELEQYLYQQLEQNAFLELEKKYKRPFFKKLDLEFKDELSSHDSFSSSIIEDLQEELIFMKLSHQEKWIAQTILSSILPNGMLSVSLDSIAQYLKAPLDEVKNVLSQIQTIAPIVESSSHPIESIFKVLFKDKGSYNIALDYWSILSQKVGSDNLLEIKEVAKKEIFTQYIGNSNIQTILDKVDKSLEDLLLSSELFEASYQEQAVILKPDFIVEKISETQVNITLEEDFTIKIKQNVDLSLKKNKDLYKQAQQILNAYQKRNNLFYSLIELIIQIQKSYFFKGELVPLTQKNVAQALHIVPSTVSRLVSHKYFRYQEKIIPLNTLFTKNLKQIDGKELTPQSIKNEIKKILTLTKGYRITDEKMKELLENRGIYIARRTVNKYRQLL